MFGRHTFAIMIDDGRVRWAARPAEIPRLAIAIHAEPGVGLAGIGAGVGDVDPVAEGVRGVPLDLSVGVDTDVSTRGVTRGDCRYSGA